MTQKYIKNGFWAILPIYKVGFGKYLHYLVNTNNSSEFRSFINSDTSIDMLVSSYWFDAIIKEWSKSLTYQLNKQIKEGKVLMFTLTIIEIFIIFIIM